MTNSENLAGRDPVELTEEQRLDLGLSFFDASRHEDQKIAERLGVTKGDAMRIALRRVSRGQDLLAEPLAATEEVFDNIPGQE